jgi:hypothetical protein
VSDSGRVGVRMLLPSFVRIDSWSVHHETYFTVDAPDQVLISNMSFLSRFFVV